MGHTSTVIGISDHYGRAVCVAVSARDGSPVVIDRREIKLIEPGIPASPYHHETLEMEPAEAEALVQKALKSARSCAHRALKELCSSGEIGKVTGVVLREPPLPHLPGSVAEAHQSYNVTNRADGMIYHDALCRAASELGLDVEWIPRGKELGRAAEVLGVAPQRLEGWLAELRETMGPPWQKDHRESTARAIVGLGKLTKLELS